MINPEQNKAVIEDDVTFTPSLTSVYDYDVTLDGGNCFRIRWQEGQDWESIHFPDFAEWMRETGRITHFSEERGGSVLVEYDDGYWDHARQDWVDKWRARSYSFQQYLDEFRNDLEQDFLAYKTCQG